MSALKAVAWHLSGFIVFAVISWGSLTLVLMLPDSQHWWAAWATAGMMILRTALVTVTLMSGYLAISWLFKPAEMD